MLAPRTHPLQKLFREDSEVAFFDDAYELIKKAKQYLSAPHARVKIAGRGLERVRKDKHNNIERARQIDSDIRDWQANQ